MAMRQLRNKGPLFFAVGVFFLLAGLAVYVKWVKPVFEPIVPKTGHEIDFVFEGVRISHLYDGKLVWVLNAAHATVDYETDRIVLTQTSGDFYEENERTVSFVADSSLFHIQASNLQLKNSEVLFYLDNAIVTLNARQIVWNSTAKTLSGRGDVRLNSRDMMMTGPLFEVSFPIQKMVFPYRSSLHFYTQDGR